MLESDALTDQPDRGNDAAYQGMAQRFGQNVRDLRQAAGLTQDMLAQRCTKYKQQIAQIEDGTARVNLSMIFVLSQALKVDPSRLLR